MFAFRLHQFLSKGGTVYSTLESVASRAIETTFQVVLPGQPERLHFEGIMVWNGRSGASAMAALKVFCVNCLSLSPGGMCQPRGGSSSQMDSRG